MGDSSSFTNPFGVKNVRVHFIHLDKSVVVYTLSFTTSLPLWGIAAQTFLWFDTFSTLPPIAPLHGVCAVSRSHMVFSFCIQTPRHIIRSKALLYDGTHFFCFVPAANSLQTSPCSVSFAHECDVLRQFIRAFAWIS